MEVFYRESSQKCDDFYELALNIWCTWTETQPSITVYHAISSLFSNFQEFKLIPDEFIKVAEHKMLNLDFQVKGVCLNRWNLFLKLLKQPQCKQFWAKTCMEIVTPDKKEEVAAFWKAFQQNISSFSRKRKVTVYPDLKIDEIPAKKSREESIDKKNDIMDILLAEIFTSCNESDSKCLVIIDDEGDPPNNKMKYDKVTSIAEASQNDKIINFGAYPEYDFSLVKKRSIILKALHPKIYEKANDEILQHYYHKLQNEKKIMWKECARKNLEEVFKLVFPSAKLFAIGSTMNGCGSYNSDLDICAVVSPEELNTEFEQKAQILDALKKVKTSILRVPDVRRLKLIKANVPILRLFFKGCFNGKGLEADINVNNINTVYNTHLIHHYSRQDERYPALCILIKLWALNAGINCARDGTFNSFSIVLLVLHYMQSGCKPAVMPNLQVTCPRVFDGKSPVDDLLFFGDEFKFQSENDCNLTYLLMGFFAYYSSFDFNKYAISVRLGRVFPRKELPSENGNSAIFIEEPFAQNNTARCVRREGLQKIKVALIAGNEEWNRRKHPNLEKIGVHLPRKK